MLQEGGVSVSENLYQQAWLVFTHFGCQTFNEYRDFDLKVFNLIFACVFQEFRRECYETYELEYAQKFTAINLSGDAFLRTCKADFHLVTDKEHLDME